MNPKLKQFFDLMIKNRYVRMCRCGLFLSKDCPKKGGCPHKFRYKTREYYSENPLGGRGSLPRLW